MKAVILAGGEGTRLRPLTSNQPKPMMPIANVPMMEHIVKLLAAARLRRHRRDRRVPGEPHPQLLRRRLRVRRAHALRDRGVAARHGRIRPQRDGRARRDVPRDLRRRRSPTSTSARSSSAHRARDAFASIALKRVENPVEFGIVITREDGTIERFLEKPTWGEVFSDTINTGHLRARTGDLRLHPRGRGRRLLRRRVPGGARRAAASSLGHVVDGYWEDVGTLEAYRARARGHPRRPGRRSSCPVSRYARACGSAKAPTSRPTPRSTARCSSATTLASKRARCCGRTRCSAPTSS